MASIIGTDPNQVPSNADLGTMAYQDYDVVAPVLKSGRKNLIINGAMQVWQRGTSFTGITTSTHTVDRFKLAVATSGTWSVTQDTDVPSGFSNSLKMDCTASTATPNQLRLVYNIEGYDVSHLAYNTADAKTTKLSFRVKTNKTGTYAVSLETTTAGRYYNTTFTVNTADTWETKTITISGDTTSALNTTNGIGLNVSFWLGAGSSLTGSGTPNTWVSDGTYGAIAEGQTVNLADSTSNYMNITGVQLELGDTATDFEHRSYGEELALCQRYCYVLTSSTTYYRFPLGITHPTLDEALSYLSFPVVMRTRPTLSTSYNTIQISNNGSGNATSVGVSGDGDSEHGVNLKFNFASGAISTHVNAIQYRIVNQTDWKFIFDAEL